MNFLIKNAFGTQLGTLPLSNMMNGSADLGDVVNSWIMFTNAGLTKFPQHPLAVFNGILGGVVQATLTSAAQFETESTGWATDAYDDIITFKGKQYYVVDYNPADHARTEALLEIVEKTYYDRKVATLTSDAAVTKNLDLLWAAIQGQIGAAPAPGVQIGTQQPVLAKPLPVTGTAGPAIPTAPKVTAVAAPARGPVPAPTTVAYAQNGTFKSSKGADLDVAAAQGALAALLQKGSL